MTTFRYALIVTLICSSLFFFSAKAQIRNYSLDASSLENIPPVPIGMSGTSPDGTVLFANSRYFQKDGRPWFPVMGEMHFIRYPEQYWEDEILKMKACGISIVATYVFWNAHEYPKGVWNWTGIRNMRRFIELCGKHHMYVWLRIGPWSHGEELYGGHPEWISDMKGKRSNDPAYLRESNVLFEQIATQAKGLFFKDGGPVIGVQLENEFASGDIEHVGTLKKMALKNGIEPVFFSVTANTVFHDDKMEAIPLQGSYPYRGWESGGGGPTKDFLYGDDQWIMTDALGKVFYDVHKYPRGLCEQGCGSQVTYQNRFTVEPHVVEAHLQNQIGRGMNLIGYYMFQGGTQLPGLKEVGYPESYDFQAPLTEFGFLRPSYRDLKILHLFLKDFGEELAPMQVVRPAEPVKNERDTENLRYAARLSGDSGFIFMCNTQVRVPMPDKRFRMHVKLKNETIDFPRSELRFKGQTTAIIPVNLSVNGALMKYATAQPVSRIYSPGEEVLFLMEVKGMNVELAFTRNSIGKMVAKGWNKTVKGNRIFLTPGKGRVVNIVSSDGRHSRIVLLSRVQAENSWRVREGQQDLFVISDADLVFSQNEIQCRQLNNRNFSMETFPAVNISIPGTSASKTSRDGVLTKYRWAVPAAIPSVKIDNVSPDHSVVQIPSSFSPDISDIAVEVRYKGGSATISTNDTVITDHLFHGQPWQFGLKRFREVIGADRIDVEVFPLKQGVTGFSDSLAEQLMKDARITDIKVVPQYSSRITLK